MPVVRRSGAVRWVLVHVYAQARQRREIRENWDESVQEDGVIAIF